MSLARLSVLLVALLQLQLASVHADGRVASGFSSGWKGNISSSAPNSAGFSAGLMAGGVSQGWQSGIWNGASNLALGNYSSQPQSWDSNLGQLGVGLSPLGTIADVRDWTSAGRDYYNGRGSLGGLGMATAFLIPGASEIGKTLNVGSDVARGVANAARGTPLALPVPRAGSFNPHLPGGSMTSFEVAEGGFFLPAGRAHGANPAGSFLSVMGGGAS